MSDAIVSEGETASTKPFPLEAAAPREAPVDPLAGEWSEGLPGPVRALGIPEPRLLGTESGPAPALGAAPAALRPAYADEVEAPDAWGAADDAPAPAAPAATAAHEVVAEEPVLLLDDADEIQDGPAAAAPAASAVRLDSEEHAAAPAAAAPHLDSKEHAAAPAAAAPHLDSEEHAAAPAAAAPHLDSKEHAAGTPLAVEADAASGGPAPHGDLAPAAEGAPQEPEPFELSEEHVAPDDTPATARAGELEAPAHAAASASQQEVSDHDAWTAALAGAQTLDAPTPWSEAVSSSPEPAAPAAEEPWRAAPVPLPSLAASPDGGVAAGGDAWSPAPSTHSGWSAAAPAPATWPGPAAPARAAWTPPSFGAPVSDPWATPVAPLGSQPSEQWGAPPPKDAQSAWTTGESQAVSAEDWTVAAPVPSAPAKAAAPLADPSWSSDAPVGNELTAGSTLAQQEPDKSAFAPLAQGQLLSDPDEDPSAMIGGGSAQAAAASEANLVAVEPLEDLDLLVPIESEPPPRPADPTPAAAHALFVAGECRVAVHTRGGSTRRGAVHDLDLDAAQFVLQPQGGGSSEVQLHSDVKAIFFMLAPGEKAQPGSGAKLRVTFHDGRVIEGHLEGGEGPHGFFMIPADAQRTNTRRIYVARDAVSELKEG